MRGKLERLILDAENLEDHPRGCGENIPTASTSAKRSGSPPRMRGKLHLMQSKKHGQRDHPRGCGENAMSKAHGGHFLGSPPRMRGKPAEPVFPSGDPGITPADAGKTPIILFASVSVKDHPRGCGENSPHASGSSLPLGSPPRMRGKRGHASGRNIVNGITPADAGKTKREMSPSSIILDHPRGCGENARHRRVVSRDAGSPPRMRGKP